MPVTDCGCKVYGNQHGSFIRFCEAHGELIEMAANVAGTTPEVFVNTTIADHCARVLGEVGTCS